jgi:hypothetical protein
MCVSGEGVFTGSLNGTVWEVLVLSAWVVTLLSSMDESKLTKPTRYSYGSGKFR